MKQAAFYRDVFGWESGPGGTLSVPVADSLLAGALRRDPKDKIIYLGVDDVTASLAQVEAHGGKTIRPRFEVKGVVVIGLFTDPAGNSMGLVEIAGRQAQNSLTGHQLRRATECDLLEDRKLSAYARRSDRTLDHLPKSDVFKDIDRTIILLFNSPAARSLAPTKPACA